MVRGVSRQNAKRITMIPMPHIKRVDEIRTDYVDRVQDTFYLAEFTEIADHLTKIKMYYPIPHEAKVVCTHDINLDIAQDYKALLIGLNYY